jgi:hypothetical protein
VWLPVVIENKFDKKSKDEVLKDPAVLEIDLAEISEKEIFVRKASMVTIYSNLLL